MGVPRAGLVYALHKWTLGALNGVGDWPCKYMRGRAKCHGASNSET